jgi:16S rRNA (cytosine967-C5)-methyltransferase
MGMTEVSANPGLAVRQLAVLAFSHVFEQSRPFDEFIEGSGEVAELDPRDRAFLVALAQTVFRHRAELEAVIARFLSKPLPRKAGITPLILLSAAAQLRHLHMAPHAAIDTAVRLAKGDRNALHFAGLINAVLRKVAALPPAVERAPPQSVSDWLMSRWSRDYGVEAARSMAAASLQEAPLDITVKSDADKWAGRLGGQVLPTGSVRLVGPAGAVTVLPGFAEGAWWVQDAASAIPARLFGDLEGRSCLDLCAAPGGKTMQLALAGARVTAIDLSAARLRRLKENLQRTALAAEIVQADVLNYQSGSQFDAVLLDAPCSATGTLRRHPDLLHLCSLEKTDRLIRLQQRLLDRAAALVKPGGTLVYATCSLDKEEGEGQIGRFLKRHGDFRLQPIAAGEAGLPPQLITEEGFFRSLPDSSLGAFWGLDGFFAARLARPLPTSLSDR